MILPGIHSNPVKTKKAPLPPSCLLTLEEVESPVDQSQPESESSDWQAVYLHPTAYPISLSV